MPKLRELQVIGNPLDYPTREIIKKGSKYLIRFLKEKWNSDQINGETIQLDSKSNVSKKMNKKTLQKNNTNNIANVIHYHYLTLRIICINN